MKFFPDMILIKTPSFIRSAQSLLKRNPSISGEIQSTLEKLRENPFHPHLKTHKLKGQLIGSFACRVNYDLRIVFQIKKEKDPNTDVEFDIVLLEAIGSHEEVY